MKLPRATGEKVVRALKRAGFEEVGMRGSHQYLHHPERGIIVTVPVHSGKTLAPKTLQAILFQAGISLDEFLSLL
ncbi:type II toxin-antitoxin system HicA family toxin [uncultured Methanofollis sp.]|uniref:type II toxin-antitoxin system HicA family toxin n=1 Tax=uncultured Methanofollis sp. TaxID=262500 RepID=UPI00260DB07B|nr:type II toxin-antitoxin system HicA family toxin [uncultured Methanofollis sp.]